MSFLKLFKILSPSFLLRAGLAFSFFYAAIGGFTAPENWIGWLPEFVRSEAMLAVFGAGELLLGFWLLSGLWGFWAGIVSGLALLGIVIFNTNAIIVVFRDLGLALAAFALAALSRDQKK